MTSGKNWGLAGGFAGAGFLGGIATSLLESNFQQQQQDYQWQSAVKQTQRENAQQLKQIGLANKRAADVYGYQTDRFKQQLGLIKEEYSRAGVDLQRQMQGAFAQSAYARQAQLAQLAQVTGYNAAATGGGNRSRQRADVLSSLATFGRNQAMEAERLSGVVAQTQRDRQALGRQVKQSVFDSFGDLGILPEMQRYYGAAIPDAPMRMNSGMMIAKAGMAGFSGALGGLGIGPT